MVYQTEQLDSVGNNHDDVRIMSTDDFLLKYGFDMRGFCREIDKLLL